MPLSAKTIRTQLAVMRPLLEGCSLEMLRKGQNMIGDLMGMKERGQVVVKPHHFEKFEAAWVVPKDERRQGVILYLHGGGYTCGELEYAQGVGALLAAYSGNRVFCPAYRLAPEHRFPAAVEDALESYKYLLSKGYAPERITLCGESAGGGLCYSLCQLLRQEGLAMPACIIAISPWTDLTASGASYEENRDVDPSMTAKMLNFYADCYTDDRTDPLVSPLFADLSDMPPSLIFVGGDEIMRSDADALHEKLCAAGRESRLVVAPDRWHGYLLYGIVEDEADLTRMNRFLNEYMCKERKLRWLRLDNAAKIYPAARRQNWSNVFRLSATLTEKVDVQVLQSALDVTARRFPSMAARLRKGVFWYYLQQLEHAPPVVEECSYPLRRMSKEEMRRCALRVIAYDNRIAIELFHSLTDGNGALVFLKTLVAEYLQQKYGVYIPAEQGVLGRLEEPSEEELEDSFQKYAGASAASRKEKSAWRFWGTPEKDGWMNLTCFHIPVAQALAKAHEYGVTLTVFMSAVVMQALQQIQAQKVPDVRRRKPIKVLIPVNLRKLFPSRTLRNFAMYTTPELLTELGEYSFEEICSIVHHWLALDNTPKQMSRRIEANVSSERMMAVKIMPLFMKNIVMKAIFDTVGERYSFLSISNLGAVKLPKEMQSYVRRMDFILGVQATAPYNCGIVSYGDTMYMNFIRSIREPELETAVGRVLKDLGVDYQVEGNCPG
ncbi:MAG: alpha/beta hydrolase fold domain-containing protein [Oscillospiraceae bacterium]|nr:alpha/beta hydrolase fold domain-containing protein [Oscillospiraceae bacterium]